MQATKSETGELLEQIYQRLDIETALAELEPKKSGQSYMLTCPECSKRRAFIYEGGHKIECNRVNECGYKSSLWDYVATRDALTEGRDIIRALADMAGYELPSLTPEVLEAIKRAEAKQSKLETAQAIFTARLFSKEGKPELEYLYTRGYTDTDIADMGLGAVPAKSALVAALKDRIADQDATVTELNVTGFGDTHTLSIPFRNRRGQLIGWSVRAITPDIEPKYKYSVGMSTGDELFNLDRCKGLTNLIVVEAPIDALIATVRGIPGVVACGRNKPTDKQLDGLKRLGVVSLTLALDNDEAGLKGTEETIYKLAELGLQSYVVSYPPKIKDLDEFIKQHGAGKVFALTDIDTATPGHVYLINLLDIRHRKGDIMSDAEQRAIMRDLIELEAKLLDNLATRDITNYLVQKLEIPPELIHQAMQEHRESKQLAERAKGYQQLQVKAGQLVKEGNYNDLEQLYSEQLPHLRAKNVRTILEPYTSDLLVADLQLRREGYTTGFHELDEYALIQPEALTIVAGRPSHGKTTVMLNMLYNLVMDNPDQSFYFFSYEETKSQLAIKLITLMAGVTIDQYRNTQRIEQYFKTGFIDDMWLEHGLTVDEAKKRLDKAKATYDRLAKNGRIWLVDEPLEAPDLAATIEEATRTRNNVGVVFVDYMQKIRSNYGQPTRQAEIAKVSAELLDVAKRSGVAIVAAAQFKRNGSDEAKHTMTMADLRESGDIEQDAHLILSLFNHAKAEYDAGIDQPDIKGKASTTIDIKILKNRSGVVNETTSLTFHGPTLKLNSTKSIDTKGVL